MILYFFELDDGELKVKVNIFFKKCFNPSRNFETGCILERDKKIIAHIPRVINAVFTISAVCKKEK
jgi:hypothetical protein